MHPKVGTCCYCGTRAALVLTGETRHELACSACGAPLHELKAIKVAPAGKPKPAPATARPRATPRPTPRRKPPKRRKSWKRKLLGEAIDLIEDIFD